MERIIFTCKKCTYYWISTNPSPTRCPSCQTLHWKEKEELPIPPKQKKDEEWKILPKSHEQYQISSFGRVYSNKQKRVLKTNGTSVSLPMRSFPSNKIVMKNYTISHLVLRTFKPDEPEMPRVLYHDGDRFNVKLSNIEWR